MVAYNKVDLPDSGDYWDEISGALGQKEGVPRDDILAISAVTGRGVAELVRRVRAVLDALPQQQEAEEESLEQRQEGMEGGGAERAFNSHRRLSGPCGRL